MNVQPLTPFQAFQLIVPMLQEETPSAYERWQGRFEHQMSECIVGGPHNPDCTLIAGAFDGSILDDFLNELFDKQKYSYVKASDLIVMSILCAFAQKKYEVVRHLTILFYDSTSKLRPENR